MPSTTRATVAGEQSYFACGPWHSALEWPALRDNVWHPEYEKPLGAVRIGTLCYPLHASNFRHDNMRCKQPVNKSGKYR